MEVEGKGAYGLVWWLWWQRDSASPDGAPGAASGSRTGVRVGTRGWQASCADSIGWGWSQERLPDEEEGPEGDRISKHVVQAQVGTASRREWPVAILGCRGGE